MSDFDLSAREPARPFVPLAASLTQDWGVAPFLFANHLVEGRRCRGVDSVDAALLRELWRGGSLGMVRHNPRLSTTTLARSVNLDRSSVRGRLQRWRDEGFLVGFHAIPNPSLFGYTVTGSGISVENPSDKAAALAALAKVEESLSWIDHVGPWIGIASIVSSPMHARTLQEVYAKLPGVDEATPLFDSKWQRTHVDLTPLDWRILRALRHEPEAKLQDIATIVGASPGTVTRRHERLVQGGAVMVLPEVDFTQYTGAALCRLLVHLEEGSDPGKVARVFRDRPETLIAFPLATENAPPFVDIYSHLPSPGHAEPLEMEARAIQGVTATEVLWPRDHRVKPSVLDEHLARAIPPAA